MSAKAPVLLAALLLALAMPACAHTGRIVVLLGEADAFLQAAKEYWKARPSSYAIADDIHSLAELRELLAAHPARGNGAWREIVLVGHASQWGGLSIPIYADDPERGLGRLREVHSSGEFPALGGDILGSNTAITLEGCGIGHRPDVLGALGNLLGGDGVARISGSRHLIAYWSKDDGTAYRAELPYRAEVVAEGRSLSSRVSAMRSALASSVSIDEPWRWRVNQSPISLRVELSRAATAARASALQLAKSSGAVRERLLDYAIRPEQLRWSLETAGEDRFDLVGRASLLLVLPELGIADSSAIPDS
jgi:hypothetical protein